MTARIYKPAKTAMQSGWAKTKDWALEFVPTHGRIAGPSLEQLKLLQAAFRGDVVRKGARTGAL